MKRIQNKNIIDNLQKKKCMNSFGDIFDLCVTFFQREYIPKAMIQQAQSDKSVWRAQSGPLMQNVTQVISTRKGYIKELQIWEKYQIDSYLCNNKKYIV